MTKVRTHKRRLRNGKIITVRAYERKGSVKSDGKELLRRKLFGSLEKLGLNGVKNLLKDIEGGETSDATSRVFFNPYDWNTADLAYDALYKKAMDSGYSDEETYIQRKGKSGVVNVRSIVPTQGNLQAEDVIKNLGRKQPKGVWAYKYKGKYYLYDGHHKVAASIIRGDSDIKVEKIVEL